MELFLTQNDFIVRSFSSLEEATRLDGGSRTDFAILSQSDQSLPKPADIERLREVSQARRIYLLGEGFNREEIGRFLSCGVSGIFSRPLRPLAIIRKLKEDLDEGLGDDPDGNKSGGEVSASSSMLTLGPHGFTSSGWQELANIILGHGDFPTVLFVQSRSSVIFRLFVEKLQRRLPSAHLVFFDGPESMIRSGVVAEIEYGQWRRPPVVAVYSDVLPQPGLIRFFLDDLNLRNAGEDGLLRLVLGSGEPLEELYSSGRIDEKTHRFLRQFILHLPLAESFREDWGRLLEFRVQELVRGVEEAGMANLSIPSDLFEGVDLSASLGELEGFAQWLASSAMNAQWPEEPMLRALARNIAVFSTPEARRSFNVEDEVEVRSGVIEDELEAFLKNG